MGGTRTARAPDCDDDAVPPPSRPPARTISPLMVMVTEKESLPTLASNMETSEDTITTRPLTPLVLLHQEPSTAPITDAAPLSPSLHGHEDETADDDRNANHHLFVPPHQQLLQFTPPLKKHTPRVGNNEQEAIDDMRRDRVFLSSNVMTTLDKKCQENTSHTPSVPGAISVQGGALSPAQDTRECHHDIDDENPLPLAAELAPDDVDGDPRISDRWERKIAETIEEHVKLQLQTQLTSTQQYQQQLRLPHHHHQQQLVNPCNHSRTVLRAEVLPIPSKSNVGTPSSRVSTSLDDNFKVCGLRRRVWGFLLFIGLLLAIGGAVVFFVYTRSKNDQIDESEVSPDTTPSTENPRVIALRTELFPVIVPLDTVEEQEPFADPSSPQSMAWHWIELDPISLSSTTSTERVMERYVLAVLYYATNGPAWIRNNFGYLSSADVCQWNNGLDPWLDTLALGIFCSLESVSHILLHDNGLKGVIPWELSLLSDLEGIVLDKNSLEGTIPTEVTSLSQLQIFWASSNVLTGTLLTSLGMSMQSIDLSNNELSGTIPEIWAHTMPHLLSIGLGSNKLEGSLPSEWVNLEFLEQLDLASNSLKGTIPNYGEGWLNMKSLFLENNHLSGNIPDSLAQMTALENLVLYNNSMTGKIPGALGELAVLAHLSLAANDFEGSLDDTLCLTVLDSVSVETDCLPDPSSGEMQVQCSCCTTCCSKVYGFCEVYHRQ